MHVANYSAIVVQDTQKFCKSVSGGALSSTSLKRVGKFTIRGSELYCNSMSDMNPNFQTRNSLKVQVLDSSFANNSASVSGGGAICASAISISIYQALILHLSAPLDRTVQSLYFSDNTSRSGGDAVHACSSEVTVESSDGLSSGNMAGQCLLFDNFPGASTSGGNFPGTSTSGGNFPVTNGGVSQYYYYYVINLPLISLNFVMLVTLIMY